MGDMNFPDPNTTTEHDGWDWDSDKWTKWGSCGVDDITKTKAIASGVMTTGEMVVINADGTVSVVDGGLMSGEVVDGGYSDASVLMDNGAWSKGCFDPSSGKVVIAHKFNNSSDDFTALSLGTVSEDSVVFSTPYELQPATGPDPAISTPELVFDASSNSVVLFYGEFRPWDKYDHKIYARVISVSGDHIVESGVGPKCLLDDTGLGQIKATFDPNSNQIVIAYGKWYTGSSSRLHITTGKVSGDEITFGTAVPVSSPQIDPTQNNDDEHFDVAFDPIANRAVVAWREYNAPKYGKARVGKVVGDTIELGTETVWKSSEVPKYILQCQYESKSEKIIIHFWGSYGANLIAGTVHRDTEDNTIQFGSEAQYLRVSVRGMMACDPYTGTIQIAYSDMSDTKSYIVSATVDGTVITFGDATEIVEDDGGSQIQCIPAGDALCLKTSYILQGGHKYPTRALSIAHTKPDFIQTNLTSDNFIGVSKGNYADGSEATVQVLGINSDQQGMTIGKQYIQPDGSLDTAEGDPSVIAGTAISSTKLNIKDLVGCGEGEIPDEGEIPAGVGDPVAFLERKLQGFPSAVYHPPSGKIVLAYADFPNSQGLVVTATVSGKTITFGTPTVFTTTSSPSKISAVYDAKEGRVVIAFLHNDGGSHFGSAVVATVTGDSVSVGAPKVFNNTSMTALSAAYDSTSYKVIIAFSYTNSMAVVGTVVGDDISFGSARTFAAGQSHVIKIAYDPLADRTVAAFRRPADSYGICVAGKVSGDTIAFENEYVFRSSMVLDMDIVYEPVAGKVAIAYADKSENEQGTIKMATVSGDAISYGLARVFWNDTSKYFATAYDSVTGRVIIGFHQKNGPDGTTGCIVSGVVSGDSIAVDQGVTATEGALNNTSMVYDPVAGQSVFFYGNMPQGDQYEYGLAVVYS